MGKVRGRLTGTDVQRFINMTEPTLQPQNYRVQGKEIRLYRHEKVFAPSAHGQFFAEHITVNPKERVIDIGTGAGILAIHAALKGAKVEAIDIVPQAVPLVEANATLNNVQVTVRQGEFFAGASGEYDVIMANLPQEIVPPDDRVTMGEQVSAVFGGDRGNDLVLEFLKQAPGYMHAHSRLYLPLHTLSDYQHTLKHALNTFKVRIVSIGDLEAKPFVVNNLGFYQQLQTEGAIRLFQRNGVWFTNVFVLEMQLL